MHQFTIVIVDSGHVPRNRQGSDQHEAPSARQRTFPDGDNFLNAAVFSVIPGVKDASFSGAPVKEARAVAGRASCPAPCSFMIVS